MERADEGEQAPRRVGVGGDLALEPGLQQLRAFVVQAAPAHIQRLDLLRRGVADGVVIALADHEVVLDHPPERREREQVALLVVGALDVERQPVFRQRDAQVVGALVGAVWLEVILLQQIEDRDLAFLLLVTRGGAERVVVDDDALQPVLRALVGHWLGRAWFDTPLRGCSP